MSKKVLIACEESQTVCKAFRQRGFEAYSCDIQKCSGGHPEWHIFADVREILSPNRYDVTIFITSDGLTHYFKGTWDLIIAHPPCTRLCSSGQRWLHTADEKYNRLKKSEQMEAIHFFGLFIGLRARHVAIENPVGIMSTIYKKPDQIYNPYDFEGETECKKTCLWLKNLPKLAPTQVLPINKRTHNIWLGYGKKWGSPECARLRSKTPQGVAEAMAEQWGRYINEHPEN